MLMITPSQVEANRLAVQMELKEAKAQTARDLLFLRIRTWAKLPQVQAVRRYYENPDIELISFDHGLVTIHSEAMGRTLIIDEFGKRHVLPEGEAWAVRNVKGRASIVVIKT